MKISSAILTVLLANTASGFAPAPVSLPRFSALSSTTDAASADEAKAEIKVKVDDAENDEVKAQLKIKVDEAEAMSELIAAGMPKEEVETVVKAVVEETPVPTETKVEDTVDPSIYDSSKRIQTGRYDSKEYSIAVPFLKRPSKLDGSHAGDVGFDPLGFTETSDMYYMMEAEIRHARLAMLAVVGWPLSELVGPNWLLHGPNHVAPSVLNGFDPLSFITVAAIFGGAGYFEYKTSLRRTDDKEIGKKHVEDMANVWDYGVPGDYNWDPLNLYSILGDTADGRKALREAEIAHGRSAMVGITSFVAWEALTGHPIVENNLLFHPNAVVPALALAYFSFGLFFEIENNDQYLLQIKTTSEGEARMAEVERKSKRAAEQGVVYAEIAAEYAKKYSKIAVEKYSDAKTKYDQVNADYTEYVMRNIESESK